MAKKRRKDKEEEEYEFVPPDFDEKEFLKKELSDTKAVIITIGYGILFGVLAAILASFDEAYVLPSMLIGVAGCLTVKYFYALIRIDTSGFNKKNWAGNIAYFFFTFLAVFVITINYPIIDYSDPTVDQVIVWVDDGTTVAGIEYEYSREYGYQWIPTDLSIVKSETQAVNITAAIADTSGIASAEIAIGSSMAARQPMQPVGDSRYEYSLPLDYLSPGTDLTFYIFVVDQNKNEQTFHPEDEISVI